MKRNRYLLFGPLRIAIFLLLAVTAFPLASLEAPDQQEPLLQAPLGPSHEDPLTEKQHRDMEKRQNVQRQQDIRRDTEKLLELSTELKQYVDKTNENIISIDVIKKTEQIEKLAKSIREKMRGMD